MTLHSRSAIRADYPFLAQPPPQKKRPVQPLPAPPSSPPSTPVQPTRGLRRRSSTFSAIASWAAHVQPGSPASLSPRSPHRRPSLCRSRRSSAASFRVPSASFLHIAPTPTTVFAPTPSLRDFKADLTTVGYTSVFLHLPNTPVTASVNPMPPNNVPLSPVPSPTCKPRGFTRFRSLSILRSRGRSKFACPNSPTKMRAKAAAAAVKRNKAKYAMRPPPLANELALVQFVDGGNSNDNVKRVMKAQAKASGAAGLADVFRDGEGGVWLDQDEELEYAHLLGEGDVPWVTFGGNTSPSAADASGEDRRDSVSSQDSDLDPKYAVQPVDSLDLALFRGAVMPLATHKPPVPRRTAQHLRKPDFLVDVAFSRLHASPKSPRLPTSSSAIKSNGKTRRRPAPLKLSPPSPAFKPPMNSPIDADKVRKDFIDASFHPVGLPTATPVATTPTEARARLVANSRPINVPRRAVHDGLPNLGMKKKPSMLNMMGLFRSR